MLFSAFGIFMKPRIVSFFGSIKKIWNLQWSLCCLWVWNMKTQKLRNESECKWTSGCEKHENTKVKVKGRVLSFF
jgi:hypothetical protein